MLAGLFVWLAIVLFIIIFILVFIFSSIRVRVQYRYEHGEFIWKMSIRFWGIQFRHYQGSSGTGKSEKYVASLIAESFHDTGFQSFYKTIKQWKNKYTSIIHLTLPKLKVKKFCWQTNFGTGDACSTGIIAGTLWSVKGCLGVFVQEKCIIKEIPQIMVTPQFQAQGLYSEFDCIASVKLGKAIRIRKKLKQILQEQA